ncbi:MAG: AraC family transcriptional regulator [Kiritimatiellae bacterium]|nr:AraC family transcriptional regulator [Kiritimatiellia bacterium]
MKSASMATGLDYRQRVCRAMDFISANLGREPSLEEIAQAANFSVFHFHRIFSAVTGETVFGFLRRLRLERAANRLLADPRADITSVALECGFSSSQNFAKAFRARFGESPSEFRRRKGGNKTSKGREAVSLRVGEDVRRVKMVSPNKKRRIKMKANVKELPAWHVAYVRKLGPYGKEVCEAAFGELMRWAGPLGLVGKVPMLGVYWDSPEVTPPEKCRTDACLVVPAGTKVEPPVALQEIAGGPHLVCEFNQPATDFSGAWDEAFRHLVQSGLECDDRPCYERYHDDCTGPTCRFDICIPLKTQ